VTSYESNCTCDDESTLVSVDMGYQNGGTVAMCSDCYDYMMSGDDE
jgi:hypothetical protein